MDLTGAAAAKARANDAFVNGRFSDADALYTEALACLAEIPVPVTGAVAAAKAAAALAARQQQEEVAVVKATIALMAAEGEVGSEVTRSDGGVAAGGKSNGNGANGHHHHVNGGGDGLADGVDGPDGNPHVNGVAKGDEDFGEGGEDEDANDTNADSASVASDFSMSSGTSDDSVYPGPAEDGLGGDVREVSEGARAKAVLLANRSMARIRLEQYGFAITDANDALALDPTYAKSLYRRGAAYFALGQVAAARRDFRDICRRVPQDADARAKLGECEKVLREERFARALDGGYESDGSVASGGSGVSACESVDWEGLVVEETYSGPAIGAGGVDVEFVKKLIHTFRDEGKLHYKYAVQIMLEAKALFEEMPNIVEVPVPAGTMITVCGDVHGQFYDLVDSIFWENGLPSAENPYVFNGDFVDRGSFSVEVILLLLSLKVACPASIHLTRGNHESLNMNKIYGFEGEVRAKYSKDVMFRMFTELFQSLPLGYILDGSVDGASDGKRAFIVHGGLFSRDGVTIADLQQLERRREPDDGLMAEMLWSDPQDAPGWGPSKRGIGVAFGPDVTHRFLDSNGLDIIIRSHEMKDEGYEIGAEGRLITIFSAPNYCDQMGNKGAFITFDCSMKPKFTQFTAVPHPDVRAMAYAGHGGLMGLM